MDAALWSTLIPSLKAGITCVLLSYDIGCQFYKNLQARLDSYAEFPNLLLADLEFWKVVVPKFHLYGHGTECHVLFNLAFTKWAGRMDGERIEGGWAQTIGMATWTRESGLFARRNILDDHWNTYNWSKLLGLRTFRPSAMLPITDAFHSGAFLDKNLQRSFTWSKTQRELATLLSASYSDKTVDAWRKMRDEFDLDQSKPNPYEEIDNCKVSLLFKRVLS